MEYIDHKGRTIEVNGKEFTEGEVSSVFNSQEEMDAWLIANRFTVVTKPTPEADDKE